jgi:hypothetical protein
MAKKPRNYGWSPEQMARINARRQAKGKDLYIDKDMGGEDYMNRYESESGKYGSKAAPNKPAFPSERPSALDQYKGQKSLSERMAEKGSLKSEIQDKNRASQVGRAVKSEDEKRKRKGGKGISTPSLQGSYNRFTA